MQNKNRPPFNEKSPALTKPSGAVSLGGGSPNPEDRKVQRCFASSTRVGHNAGMAPAHDFKLALTRVIEPSGGPWAELATLEDAAASFCGTVHLCPISCTCRPGECGRAGAMRRRRPISPRTRLRRLSCMPVHPGTEALLHPLRWRDEAAFDTHAGLAHTVR